MHRTYLLALVSICAIGIGACAKTSQPATTPASAEASASAEAMAAASPAESGSPTATVSPAQGSPSVGGPLPAASGSAAATTAAAAATPLTVTFTDVSGIFAEQAIKNEAALGVFESTSGSFRPTAPITRAEFVRWLVKANNAYYASDPTKQIRPAEGTEQAFLDVPPSQQDYKYIQALASAGFVIGIDAHHFAPAENLTREQMIAIKVGVDLGGDPYKNTGIADVRVAYPVSDLDAISKRYYDAIYGDYFDHSRNIPRVFGQIKTFQPQKPVTRAEAALCLDSIGNYNAMTSTKALSGPTTQ